MTVLGVAALACAAAGILYLGLAAILVLHRSSGDAPEGGRDQRGRGQGDHDPAVTILKPLHGLEPGLFDNLASFCRQSYGGPVEIVFGVQNPDDPAIGVVRRIERAFPRLPITLVVDARLHGANRKVSNLVNMSPHIRHEIVVLADSDMRVGPDYLAGLAGCLARSDVGAVTCLYHGIPAGSRWSQLSALSIDTHFLPSVVVGTALGLAKPCFGSTIALRRETLAAIGGFGVLSNELADDYALGAAVRRLGLRVSQDRGTRGSGKGQTQQRSAHARARAGGGAAGRVHTAGAAVGGRPGGAGL